MYVLLCLNIGIWRAVAYTSCAKKTCKKLKPGLHTIFSQKSLPRTPPQIWNVWRGYKDLLESLLKKWKSCSLPKLYTVKNRRLKKNKLKKTDYNNMMKRQNFTFKACFMFKITQNSRFYQKKDDFDIFICTFLRN